jgi:hypothetical protein
MAEENQSWSNTQIFPLMLTNRPHATVLSDMCRNWWLWAAGKTRDLKRA